MTDTIIVEKHLMDNSYAVFHYASAVNEATVKITQRGKLNGKLKIVFTFKIELEVESFKQLVQDVLFKEVDKDYIIEQCMKGK